MVEGRTAFHLSYGRNLIRWVECCLVVRRQVGMHNCVPQGAEGYWYGKKVCLLSVWKAAGPSTVIPNSQNTLQIGMGSGGRETFLVTSKGFGSPICDLSWGRNGKLPSGKSDGYSLEGVSAFRDRLGMKSYRPEILRDAENAFR